MDTLAEDVERIYEEYSPDEALFAVSVRHWEPFRYDMLNRNAAVERAIANRKILSSIEPLLGDDCHVIANTAWWQPPDNNKHGGQYSHIDSGPHGPSPSGVPWDVRIPNLVFAVAARIYLMDCPLKAGPTPVIPRSHMSGQPPPLARAVDDDLDDDGVKARPLVSNAGDIALFVSDIWQHRLPSPCGDPGRMFIRCHNGRRDLTQRLRPTAEVNRLSDEARARAKTKRQRTLVGLYRNGFDDG